MDVRTYVHSYVVIQFIQFEVHHTHAVNTSPKDCNHISTPGIKEVKGHTFQRLGNKFTMVQKNCLRINPGEILALTQ